MVTIVGDLIVIDYNEEENYDDISIMVVVTQVLLLLVFPMTTPIISQWNQSLLTTIVMILVGQWQW